ncbi:sodium:proton exchanger [Candidatus Woesearchaeota archaeon]|nr:sodium:proton exchanger [Candidatus Woesearchaeota archaeon]
MNPEIFTELSMILLITVVVTGIMKILRQPSIIGYIISGILAGPFVFNIIDSHDTLNAFSHIGIALLLFLVGLNLNPRVIKDVGKISLVTGLGQVIFTTSIGFVIIRSFGFSTLASLYIAVALAFSSTIIIMKLLSDKRDLESLYGRISIGFLIVQDFIAIVILLAISTLNTKVNMASMAFETILKGIGGILVLFLLTIYLLPKLTRMIAKSQEFLLLFSLSWCFIIASAFHYLNFSIEAGALLAGITLSMSPYHFEISSRMRPLRDFFLILFFIVLGSKMIFSNIFANLPGILIFSFFVLVGNPLIVMILMGLLGYTKRNSFLCGLTVAQISEFSLIVINMGVSVGHLSSSILSLVTAVGLITFAGSTYMIMYSHKIYPKLSRFLSIFEKKGKKVDEHKYHEHDDHDIVIFGYDRIGFDILESLKKIKKKFLIIDYDPEIITKLSKDNYDCMYGDANDSELLEELNLSQAKMVISTIPEMDTNLLIIKKVKEINKKAIIVVVSHHIEEAERLYEEGATYVIMPNFLGGQHFSTLLERNKLKMEKFLEEKIAHIEHIKKRKKARHKHIGNRR